VVCLQLRRGMTDIFIDVVVLFYLVYIIQWYYCFHYSLLKLVKEPSKTPTRRRSCASTNLGVVWISRGCVTTCWVNSVHWKKDKPPRILLRRIPLLLPLLHFLRSLPNSLLLFLHLLLVFSSTFPFPKPLRVPIKFKNSSSLIVRRLCFLIAASLLGPALSPRTTKSVLLDGWPTTRVKRQKCQRTGCKTKASKQTANPPKRFARSTASSLEKLLSSPVKTKDSPASASGAPSEWNSFSEFHFYYSGHDSR
jgi:hypothetical protein